MLNIMLENGRYFILEDGFTEHPPCKTAYEVGCSVNKILADAERRRDKLMGRELFMDSTNVHVAPSPVWTYSGLPADHPLLADPANRAVHDLIVEAVNAIARERVKP